jgi:hypothetical protein
MKISQIMMASLFHPSNCLCIFRPICEQRSLPIKAFQLNSGITLDIAFANIYKFQRHLLFAVVNQCFMEIEFTFWVLYYIREPTGLQKLRQNVRGDISFHVEQAKRLSIYELWVSELQVLIYHVSQHLGLFIVHQLVPKLL